MGGDRAFQAASVHVGRGLYDRFPDGLRAAPVHQISRQDDRGGGVAVMLLVLRQAVLQVRPDLRLVRTWRGREIAFTRARPGRGGPAWGRAWRILARPARSGVAASAWRGGQRAVANLCRSARRGEARANRGRCVCATARQSRRASGAARRRAAAGAIPRRRNAANACAGLRQWPRRSRPLAGERRSLRVGHGRRDVRHFDHRGAGVGLAGGRGCGGGDAGPRQRSPRAARASQR